MTTQANNQSALTKQGATTKNDLSQTTPQVSTPIERFTNEVLRQFSLTAGEVNITEKQRRLIRNYFLRLDFVLQTSEKKRNPQKNGVPYTWEHVDLKQLSIDVANHSLVGLDPIQKNHLNLIPHFDTASQKYGITFMPGFKGIEFKAKKYGLDVPKAVIVEVVYKNDIFKPRKKNGGGVGDSYEFEIVNPFERGEVVGGFYFHEFEDPSNNKLRIFSLSDIKKRIPKYASPEFWGGERNGQKVEGWFDEMCYKTIARAAYDSITIDPDKIDEVLIQTMFAEQQALEAPTNTEDVVHQEIGSKPIFIVQTEEGFIANPGTPLEQKLKINDLPEEKEELPKSVSLKDIGNAVFESEKKEAPNSDQTKMDPFE